MKTLPYVVGSAVSLFVLLAPVRAEELAPAPASKSPVESSSSLGATLLVDLLKQAASATSEKETPVANAAATDAQTQELQALLISVMKSLAQMLPQLLAALDQGGSDALNDFLGGGGAAGPAKKKEREVGLHSSGLKTNGLNPDGSSSAVSDEDWKRQFQRHDANR